MNKEEDTKELFKDYLLKTGHFNTLDCFQHELISNSKDNAECTNTSNPNFSVKIILEVL